MRVMLPANGMAVVGVGMPLHSPTAANVAVVLAHEHVEGAREGGDQRDVRERTADEVVSAVRGPVDDVVNGRHEPHDTSLTPVSGVIARQKDRGRELGIRGAMGVHPYATTIDGRPADVDLDTWLWEQEHRRRRQNEVFIELAAWAYALFLLALVGTFIYLLATSL